MKTVAAAVRPYPPADEVAEEDLPDLPPEAVDVGGGVATVPSAPVPQAPRRGTVVTFVGSKGGCGSTLLAVNVAGELAQDKRVCLLDFAGSNGDIAAYMDLYVEHQIAELLREDHIDGALLSAVAVKHRSGVSVFPQPANLGDVALLEPLRVSRIITAARKVFDVVIIDCSTHLDEATLTAVVQSDVVALVLTPDLAAVRNANRRLRLFQKLPMDMDAVRLVRNRGGRRKHVTDEQIEENLKRPIDARIHKDSAGCARSQLTGQLLSELPGHARIKEDVRRLGAALLGEDDDDLWPRRGLVARLRTALNLENR